MLPLEQWILLQMAYLAKPELFHGEDGCVHPSDFSVESPLYEKIPAGLKLESLLSAAGSHTDPARQTELCRGMGADVLAYPDSRYPALLREISSAPFALWCRGAQRMASERFHAAVVGTRRCTAYGRQVARALGAGIAARGAVVVSGLALGIDAEAHWGALEAGGLTVAVLGAGIDQPVPAENRTLKKKISERGCELSEFPLGTPPLPHQFPMRNRIISGMCKACVVVEAPHASGAMITARDAIEQGRDVYAVPSTIFSDTFAGCHSLIRSGAQLLRSAEDIDGLAPAQEELPLDTSAAQAPAAANSVLSALSFNPVTVDVVCLKTGRPSGEVAGALVELCINGEIREFPGRRYALRPRM